MPITPRLLRARADELSREKFPQTARDQARHERILSVATRMIADYGRHIVTFASLAMALRMSPATLRRHFIDIDAIIGDIVQTHLMGLARALGEIDPSDPDRHRRRRALYVDNTRGYPGTMLPAHQILLRDRDTLPPDLRDAIDLTYVSIGETMILAAHATPGLARKFLGIIDNPWLDQDDVEAALASLTPRGPMAQLAAPLAITQTMPPPDINAGGNPNLYPNLATGPDLDTDLGPGAETATVSDLIKQIMRNATAKTRTPIQADASPRSIDRQPNQPANSNAPPAAYTKPP